MPPRNNKNVEIPRPPCAKCGGPAAVMASLSIQELELDRDSGPRAPLYWRPSFRCATRLEVVLCSACAVADFKFNLAVSGSVVAKEVKT